MTKLISTFSFEAAHRLYGYAGDCCNIHGHSYKVEICISGEVCTEKVNSTDNIGMVIDFKEFKELVRIFLKTEFDHRLLLNKYDCIITEDLLKQTNIELYPVNPTAEVIAVKIFKKLRTIFCEENIKIEYVRLWETENNSVYVDIASL